MRSPALAHDRDGLRIAQSPGAQIFGRQPLGARLGSRTIVERSGWTSSCRGLPNCVLRFHAALHSELCRLFLFLRLSPAATSAEVEATAAPNSNWGTTAPYAGAGFAKSAAENS